jgi:hypothetical protein
MRSARYVIYAAMLVVGVLLVFDVMYYRRGSLELYPMQEDHDKVRLVTGFLAIVLAAAELALWLLLRFVRRRQARPAQPA